MNDTSPIRERYLKDDLPTRIGGIAMNLSRIKSFAAKDANRAAVESVIEESKWFIEWTAREAEIDVAAQLVELQLQLARWQHQFNSIWNDPAKRTEMIGQSGEWSQRVLEMSGLLQR
jgi:hypothetical protein